MVIASDLRENAMLMLMLMLIDDDTPVFPSVT